MSRILEWVMGIIGGLAGWFTALFAPTYSLICVMVAFVLYDSWTAFELEKRVKKRYPDKKKRPAKYASYKAWGMVSTLVEGSILILLFFALQKWVFVGFSIPLSYIATGVICSIQLLSIAENKCSCRTPGDKGYRLWKVLAKILIDKTERHFDTDLSDLKQELDNSEETEEQQ